MIAAVAVAGLAHDADVFQGGCARMAAMSGIDSRLEQIVIFLDVVVLDHLLQSSSAWNHPQLVNLLQQLVRPILP